MSVMIKPYETTSLNTAAVLMTFDFECTGAKYTDDNKRRIKFQFCVPIIRSVELDTLLEQCEANYDIEVPLGVYESNRNKLRDMIQVISGGAINGRVRGK